MCEYCEKGYENTYISSRTLAIDGKTYKGLDMVITDRELWIFTVANSMRNSDIYGYCEKNIPINYCPMCGRKLDV